MMQKYINKLKFWIVVAGYLSGVFLMISAVVYRPLNNLMLLYVVCLLIIATLSKIKGE